jgi:hypothetical protein
MPGVCSQQQGLLVKRYALWRQLVVWLAQHLLAS